MHFQQSSPIVATAATLLLAAGSSASALPGTSQNERYTVRRALKTGLGTRYGANCKEEDCWQKGACAFTNYNLPSTIDGSTCVSEAIWDKSAHCGGCIKVTYKGKTLTIMVMTSSPRYTQAIQTDMPRSPTKPTATPTIST
jgi:hypothetical protein